MPTYSKVLTFQQAKKICEKGDFRKILQEDFLSQFGKKRSYALTLWSVNKLRLNTTTKYLFDDSIIISKHLKPVEFENCSFFELM